jgi:hypothetical protein
MNAEQLEELEALGYIFNDSEMHRDANLFEFLVNFENSLKITIIWPQSYPECALIATINDNRLSRPVKEELEVKINQFVISK